MITLDRFWILYFERRFGIKRNKKNITILILIVFGFVFAICQVYMAYYEIKIRTLVNATYFSNDTKAICIQSNSNVVLAQNIIFVIMRIILPFVIMVSCNVILINHIRKTRKVIIRGRNKKRENSFTIAVSIMNLCFLLCNIGLVIYYFLLYYFRFSGVSLSSSSISIFSLYGTCSILFSYIFTLFQVFIDMIFNKVFRKEIFSLLRSLIRFRFKITNNSRCNTQETNL